MLWAGDHYRSLLIIVLEYVGLHRRLVTYKTLTRLGASPIKSLYPPRFRKQLLNTMTSPLRCRKSRRQPSKSTPSKVQLFKKLHPEKVGEGMGLNFFPYFSLPLMTAFSWCTVYSGKFADGLRAFIEEDSSQE